MIHILSRLFVLSKLVLGGVTFLSSTRGHGCPGAVRDGRKHAGGVSQRVSGQLGCRGRPGGGPVLRMRQDCRAPTIDGRVCVSTALMFCTTC